MLNNELRAELADPPIDVDRLDVAAFAALLESSLLLTPVS
jgi:hypothetical protein